MTTVLSAVHSLSVVGLVGLLRGCAEASSSGDSSSLEMAMWGGQLCELGVMSCELGVDVNQHSHLETQPCFIISVMKLR